MTLTPESSSISRLDGVRSNDVLGYIRRDALAIDVTNAVMARAAADGFSVPAGYTFEVAGDSEQQSNALGDLLTYLPILLILMVGNDRAFVSQQRLGHVDRGRRRAVCRVGNVVVVDRWIRAGL